MERSTVLGTDGGTVAPGVSASSRAASAACVDGKSTSPRGVSTRYPAGVRVSNCHPVGVRMSTCHPAGSEGE